MASIAVASTARGGSVVSAGSAVAADHRGARGAGRAAAATALARDRTAARGCGAAVTTASETEAKTICRDDAGAALSSRVRTTGSRAHGADNGASTESTPLTAAETAGIEERRRRVAEMLYSPGGTRNTYEGAKALAAGLKPNAPPLTAEQWRALDSIYIVGDKQFLVYIAEHASLRTALDIRSPPLTKAQWDDLDRIYHVGGYMKYEDDLAARAQAMPSHPMRLADLTPEERMVISTGRGIRLPPVVTVASKVKLLETRRRADYERRGSPATPVDAPAPELPVSLLEANAEWIVVARVHVAPDGTASFTITSPAADATVTRAAEEAFRRWRFRPTFINGYLPDDSTVELSVKISVR